ncbi:hypothetical protein MUK42_30943 [Musa troglodytarum]|uniref:Uncharacterized protein n=1 Tax=Musa troglodytarum TaxID=320322 RepID=A0A9E7KCT9_9LILI|nr:hypothetical protein MUK42_30943 [Musa troglodytarum]
MLSILHDKLISWTLAECFARDWIWEVGNLQHYKGAILCSCRAQPPTSAYCPSSSSARKSLSSSSGAQWQEVY